jgi:hypothetical protein
MLIALLVGMMFFFIGLAVLIYSLVTFIKRRGQIADWAQAVGVVTELAPETGQRGYIYCPVVQFTTATGFPGKFTSSVGRNPAEYAIGQNVNIIYDPQNPQNAEINSSTSLWFVSGCSFALGLAFTALGLVLTIIMALVLSHQP